MPHDLDLVLFGATGFTGKLVAEYLSRTAPASLRWAVAGRDAGKLAALGLRATSIVADALDATAMRALAARTRVVCTTAGPFARYGSALVAACADAGTHYCDLTGEVAWMRRMIDAHHARAQATGARIVHSCGFDSIPSDLGTWATQQEATRRFGAPAKQVTALFGEIRGGFSGGTAASGLDTAEAAGADRAVAAVLADPHALDPDPTAAHRPVRDQRFIGWESRLKMFTAPFAMSQINTRVVRRAHALAGYPWGRDFRYREAMSTPATPRGAVMAASIATTVAALSFAMSRPMLRAQVAKRAPKPGEGPSAAVRERGHWKLRLVAEGRNGNAFVYVVADRADPGYGSTAKMLGESALCLALDPLTSPGGVQTPSVAMAQPLLDRLRRAGFTFAPS